MRKFVLGVLEFLGITSYFFWTYRSIDELLDLLDEDHRLPCRIFLRENRELFESAPGSSANHQCWRGGYIDHLTEIMNLGVWLYTTLKKKTSRPLPFSLSDLLLVLFLHDLEKPWKYEMDEDGSLRYRSGVKTKAEQKRFRADKIHAAGIVLTPAQQNGLDFAEGEIEDHSASYRCMGELGALVHACDVLSARLFYGYPLASDDPWTGAKRFRS
ncbi:MAG: hypothetical protein IPK84_04605 [Candidatus Moraniibacteriota bacterium]|nr:MAG: hypothetical protein IPK84_04605 [Candidatus Moranbacteria bacterium]